MKILSPLTRVEEVLPLCLAGADQFYCGLMDKKEALNDRPNTEKFNFTHIRHLRKAVDIARKFDKDVFLAVNNLTASIDKVITQAKIAEQIGIKGVIVANLLILRELGEINLKIDLCASCLTGILNSEGIKFLKRFKVKIIHLPRHLGIKDLEAICKNNSDIELSVFGMNGMCINIEAFCSMHYLKDEYFIPCHYFKAIKIIGKKYNSTGLINKRINSPARSCGLCAFMELKELGISSVKIEGRGLDSAAKVKFVKMTREIFNVIEQGINEKEYYKYCRSLFRKSFKENCRIEYCYF